MLRMTDATPQDASAIARIHVAGWQHAYRGCMSDALLDGLSVADRTASWVTWLTREAPGFRYRVAKADGEIVGFASIGPARGVADCGELYAIYIRPDRIGTGSGRALLADALSGLRELGHDHGILWVLRDNVRARQVYAAAGWMPDGGEKAVDFGGERLVEVRYRIQTTTKQ